MLCRLQPLVWQGEQQSQGLAPLSDDRLHQTHADNECLLQTQSSGTNNLSEFGLHKGRLSL